jgi:hypothetical protein
MYFGTIPTVLLILFRGKCMLIEINYGSQNVLGVLTWVGGYRHINAINHFNSINKHPSINFHLDI